MRRGRAGDPEAKTRGSVTLPADIRGDHRDAARVPPLVNEEPMAPSPSRAQAGRAWIDDAAARLARLGAAPQDDEDLRQKKALLVLIVALILPVSVVWGCLYLGFGS
jgi:hypothetical protein